MIKRQTWPFLVLYKIERRLIRARSSLYIMITRFLPIQSQNKLKIGLSSTLKVHVSLKQHQTGSNHILYIIRTASYKSLDKIFTVMARFSNRQDTFLRQKMLLFLVKTFFSSQKLPQTIILKSRYLKRFEVRTFN
jgi:hypothetical protein